MEVTANKRVIRASAPVSDALLAEVRTRLAQLIRRFGGLASLAAELRQHPGFETTNKSTILRWQQRPNDRTLQAITLLDIVSRRASIVIATAKAVGSLPLIMAAKKPLTGGRSRLESFNVAANLEEVNSGTDALKLLEEGRVDVAAAASEFVQRHRESIMATPAPRYWRLCQISESPVLVIGKNVPFDLRDTRVGFIRGTILERILERYQNAADVVFETQALEKAETVASAFRDNRIDAFVGWDTQVQEVTAQVFARRDPTLRRFPLSYGEARLQVDLAVNLKTADRSAVRVLLSCLSDIITLELSGNPTTEFRQRLADEYGFSQEELQLGLPDSPGLPNVLFFLRLEARTVLQLWNEESNNLHKELATAPGER